MMFLLTLKNQYGEIKYLFPETEEGYHQAVLRAQEHVGEHWPEDGCSTERQEWSAPSGGNYRTWRNTSFGRREAEIEAVMIVK
jgi:hypothetical protein